MGRVDQGGTIREKGGHDRQKMEKVRGKRAPEQGAAKPLTPVTQVTVQGLNSKLACRQTQVWLRVASPLWPRSPHLDSGITGGPPSQGGLGDLSETILKVAGTSHSATYSRHPTWLNAVWRAGCPPRASCLCDFVAPSQGRQGEAPSRMISEPLNRSFCPGGYEL